MKVKVTNLGAIGEGTIDLAKKINLFCGQNGTGKTYFSYVIYGLLRNTLHVKGNTELADRLINERQITQDIDFPALLSYKKTLLRNARSEMDTFFGTGGTFLEKLFYKFAIEDVEEEEEFKQRMVATEIARQVYIHGIGIQLSKKKDSAQITLSMTEEPIPSHAIMSFRCLLHSLVLYTLAVYPVCGVQFFPVERISIDTFSKELTIREQEVLDNLHSLVDKGEHIRQYQFCFSGRRYPLPIKDGLRVAEDLAEVKKRTSPFFEFAEDLERELLHGTVQISNDGAIQFKPEKAANTLLPISMAASVVKALASWVVYLKHMADYHDLMIIEEPEVNLDPANQIWIARLLARLANKGFRLLVSTHSDYIVREFNNMVILSKQDNKSIQKMARKYGYKEDEYIQPDELNVYSFAYKTKRSRQVVVSEIPVEESGFDMKIMDEVIDRQNEISEELYYSLKHGKV